MSLSPKIFPATAFVVFFLCGMASPILAASSIGGAPTDPKPGINTAEIEKAKTEIQATDQSLENAYKDENLAQYTTVYDTARQKAETITNKSKDLGDEIYEEVSKFSKTWNEDKQKKIAELKNNKD